MQLAYEVGYLAYEVGYLSPNGGSPLVRRSTNTKVR